MGDADVWKGLQAGTADVVRQLEGDIAELRQSLASERHTATLNAECHTREIRALQDMVEAEAEARREAEGEVEHLKAMALLTETPIYSRRELIRRLAKAEDELAGWKRVAVEAAIPLEAMRMAGTTNNFCPDLREGVDTAIGIIRRAVMGEGLPPAPKSEDAA